MGDPRERMREADWLNARNTKPFVRDLTRRAFSDGAQAEAERRHREVLTALERISGQLATLVLLAAPATTKEGTDER